jgi:carbon dioxide concentrating mechanism protein CcmO
MTNPLGFLETTGMVPWVEVVDAVLKSAEVEFFLYMKVGGGRMVVGVQGELSSVHVGVDVGTAAAQRYGSASVLVLANPTLQLKQLLGPDLPTKQPAPVRLQFSLGVLETTVFVGLVKGLDAMLKAAQVELVRSEHIGGSLTSAWVGGEIGAVKEAVEAGLAAASRAGEARATVVSNPHPAFARFLTTNGIQEAPFAFRLPMEEGGPGRAVGLVETRGFVPVIAAMDAISKAAHVQIEGYDRSEEQFMAIISGDLASVEHAIEAGAAAARRVGEVVAVDVIPRIAANMEVVLARGRDSVSGLTTIQGVQLPSSPRQVPARLSKKQPGRKRR